jgi:hypothetical protein
MSIRLMASGVSSITTAIFTLPFDNIRTKIMRQKKSKYIYNI